MAGLFPSTRHGKYLAGKYGRLPDAIPDRNRVWKTPVFPDSRPCAGRTLSHENGGAGSPGRLFSSQGFSTPGARNFGEQESFAPYSLAQNMAPGFSLTTAIWRV